MSDDRKHALLSASGAKRWMSCTPSARLEESFGASTSEYANEGTFAHAYAELFLKTNLKLISNDDFVNQLCIAKQDPYYSQSLDNYIQSYVTVVMERYNDAKSRCKYAVILLEQRLDFSSWVPYGFGTGDVVIISDGALEIIDLKYGKGIPVNADNNPQLRLYALGAINQYACLYDIDMVQTTIIQPRLDSVSTEYLSVTCLLNWAESELRPKAKLAMNGDGEFVTGEHCRFCKAKATCRKRVEENLKLAAYDFKPADVLTVDEIADVLSRVDELQSWAKDVKEYALNQSIVYGMKWPGWKLVEGKSNRTYTSEIDVAEALTKAGYDEETIFTKEIKGITAMEKEIGKKNFSELLNDLIIKPPGKPTLVPENDKRPELNGIQSAISDFLE